MPRRSWWFLHWSTWVVTGVALAILAVIIVPGIPDNHGLMLTDPVYYEHGWPYVFLDRCSPLPPLPAGPSDPLMKYLKDWRDKQGLRWATFNGEFPLILGDAFAREVPSWSERDRWPIEGESLVSVMGLAFDLAVAFAILAAVACVYEWWARRRWQYGLRHLLGVVLLIAIALSWWRISMNACERESLAITALRNKGFEVSWRCGGPVWLIKLVGANHLRPFHRVVSIDRFMLKDVAGGDVQETDVTSLDGTDLNYVHIWSHLQNLHLDHTRIADADLINVEGLRELEVLDLESTLVTDAGLANLRDLPKLRFLVLDGTQVTGAGLRHLKCLPHLRELSLNQTQITNSSLSDLRELPELRDLSLDDTNVTDAGVPFLRALTGVKVIRLDGTGVTDAGLQDFEGAVQLKELHLCNTKVTDKGVARLQQTLPKCKIEWKDRWWKSPSPTRRAD